MTALSKHASARGTTGQLAFGHGEDGFNQRAATVFLARKVSAHLRSDAMNPPRFFPAFGGDDAQRMKLLADKGVIALGIELGVGQHATYRGMGVSLGHERGIGAF